MKIFGFGFYFKEDIICRQSVHVGTMWHSVYNAVYNHIFNYNQHIVFVQQNRIFYGNHHSNRLFEGKRIPLSIVHVVIPTILTALNCMRSIIVQYCPQCFNTPLMRLQFFTGILYPSVRNIFEIPVCGWTLNHVLHTVYVLRCDIVRFSFFAALVFGNEPDDKIAPSDLGSYGYLWDNALMFAL